ncbi:MAG TPA: PDZ domain-containing protein, partial [Arenimonas sp.]|uniref:PDZ domain-containing protein n=1 Tax=Arenimonas sp. TaxID=1872635 RepID=UPI002CF70DD2
MRNIPFVLRSALFALTMIFLGGNAARADQLLPAPSDSNRIATARDRVLPVVVSILTVRQDYRQGEPLLSVSSGSGTVVSAQGHIATNAHVTQNGKSFRIVFADGRELPAKLVGTDTLSDIAVLQVQPPKPETFAFAEFAKTLDLRPGDTVLAMGAPWGLSNSMSAGVVNNPRRLLVSLFDDEAEYEDSIGEDEPTGRYYAWIQHDAAIAPGNSGGPLVDLNGRIVGVNTRGMIVGGDLAFAIPGPEAGSVVRSLIDNGRVRRVSLGFRLRSLKGTGFSEGVLVNAVERGSVPENAGLRAGDRILKLNGEAINALQPIDLPALQKHIAELPIDSKVVLEVDRDGKRRQVELKATEQIRERGDENAFPPFGISATQLTAAMGRRRSLDSTQGLLVTGVRPGGPAAVARPELTEGDLLLSVDGKPVTSLADLNLAARPGAEAKPLIIRLERDGEQRLSLLTPVFGDQARTPLPELPKAWVGVEVQPFTASLAREIGLGRPGYRISRIYPGSPLAKAGAKVGDLLVALEGEPLKPANETSSEGFDQRVHDLTLDSHAKFSALRDGKPLDFDVTLAASPVDTSGLRTLAVAGLRAQLRELGFYDRVGLKLPMDRSGVIIDGVESGGAAGLAHLKRGDVIIQLGDRSVSTP